MNTKSDASINDKDKVTLGSITTHDLYDHFNELLTTTNYALTSVELFSERALEINLRLHPIIVVLVKNQTDRYCCIGGFRSLLLAKASMPLQMKIRVVLIPRPPIEEIRLMVIGDVLLTHTLFSVSSPDTIGSIFLKIHEGILPFLLKSEMRTKKAFAKNFGYSYNTLFPVKTEI